MSDVEQWTPPFAPHVTGTYERRTFDEDGMPLEQKVTADCSKCGGHWEGHCSTGQVRTHIARFATVHLHRDPLRKG
jgi:hypothetical protein